MIATIAGECLHPTLLARRAVDIIRTINRVDARKSQTIGYLRALASRHPAIHCCAGLLHQFKIRSLFRHGLVPHRNFSSFALEIVRDLCDKMRLQLAIAREVQLFVHRLTLCIVFPSRGGAFVTTDMHIFGGENLHQLIENVFHEAHCLRIRHVQHIGEDTTPGFHAVHPIGIARKLGISRHRRGEVTRHIYLGNHLNMFRSRIRHDFFQILTSIEIGTILLVRPVSSMLH